MITIEEVKSLIPKEISLYYVDYNDNLDNSLEVLQKSIREQSTDSLSEYVWNTHDSDSESIEEIINQLKSDISDKYNYKEEVVHEFFEDNEEEIKDIIREKDNSDLVTDLLKNTSSVFMFYDTGYEVESESWNWSKPRVEKERRVIKSKLGIKSNDTTYDNDIEMMIRQASYGGNLEIYFKDDISKFIQIDKSFYNISFKNPIIGIINHGNGSGDQCELNGLTITLSLNTSNIFIEKTVKYNWSYDIAGMCHDAYDKNKVSFCKGFRRKEIPLSNLIGYMEREDVLNKTFKEDKCTYGDTDFSRHRNIVYINEYPCGNKCMDCGQFWID